MGGSGETPAAIAGELVASAIFNNQVLPAGLERFGLPSTFATFGLMAAQCAYWCKELQDWMHKKRLNNLNKRHKLNRLKQHTN